MCLPLLPLVTLFLLNVAFSSPVRSLSEAFLTQTFAFLFSGSPCLFLRSVKVVFLKSPSLFCRLFLNSVKKSMNSFLLFPFTPQFLFFPSHYYFSFPLFHGHKFQLLSLISLPVPLNSTLSIILRYPLNVPPRVFSDQHKSLFGGGKPFS